MKAMACVDLLGYDLCLSTGARGDWHSQNYRTHEFLGFCVLMVPAWTLYRTDCTRSFKFLAQALKANISIDYQMNVFCL